MTTTVKRLSGSVNRSPTATVFCRATGKTITRSRRVTVLPFHLQLAKPDEATEIHFTSRQLVDRS
jgi:hypothetical protein